MNNISLIKYIKLIATFAIVSLSVALSGCSTLSKGECMEADWYDIGARDGASGKPRSRLDDHRESCKEYNVFPDREQYYMGREEGIKIYCTPENGFKMGSEGKYYAKVCPFDLEKAFLDSFNHGRKIYDVRKKIADNNRSIDRLENELSKKETKQDRRKIIREEILSLDRRNRTLRDELTYLEKNIKYRY